LIERYDILRTVYIHEGLEHPLQVVLKERQIDFLYKDVRKMEPGISGDKETFVKAFKEKDKQRLFDLSRNMLLRFAVLQLDEREYEFIWSFHHILMDGWCVVILASEYFEIYNSYKKNRTPQLSPPGQYRTYIEWLEEKDKEKSKNFWIKYLELYEETATLPKINAAGCREKGYKNERVFLQLGKEKTKRLNQLAVRNQVTINTVLQAVWAILLGLYTGKRDVVFGVVVSVRPSEIKGVETMIGLFINTMPVRINFEEKNRLNDLLQGVQKRAIDCEPHYYYSLAAIQSECVLKQNLFDHIFVLENYPISEQIFELSKNVELFEQSTYDFNIVVTQKEGLNIKFEYNGNVYDRSFIERVAHQYDSIIRQISDNEELEIRELTFVSEEKKKQVLSDLNDDLENE
jgi:iturin family lipopeptide synthetase B/iturin family lipopeptide synthetase C